MIGRHEAEDLERQVEALKLTLDNALHRVDKMKHELANKDREIDELRKDLAACRRNQNTKPSDSEIYRFFTGKST